MPKVNKDTEYEKVLAEYKQRYNVDTLDSPNDFANLRQMIRNQMTISKLQDDLESISAQDPSGLKKILDSIVALSEININLERTLGIDRKTRKNESSESVADYIQELRLRAKEFLDDPRRFLKAMCPDCKILVGRINGVYESTAFTAAFQCPQCSKFVTIERKERDIFHGVKNAEWRRKFPIEIVQPVRGKTSDIESVANELVIGDEE